MIYKSPRYFPSNFESVGLSIQEKTFKIDFQDGNCAAILYFWLEQFYLFLIYKSPRWFLPGFKSIGLLVQQKKRKIDFQDGHHGVHLGFLIRMILLLLIYQSTLCFLPSFESISLLVQEKKRKIDFQDGHHDGHLGYVIRTFLAIFDLQVTLKLPTQVGNWPFSSGEEVKNRFSRWPPWWPSWVFNQNDFTFFYLQVTPMLPTKFQVNWPFGSGEEMKIDAYCCHLWLPIGISDLQVTLMLLPSFESTGLLVQEKKRKIDLQDGHHGSHLWFLMEQF